MKDKRNLMAGFTLVELLVVISIIALLLSIMMPALSKAKLQAKQVICKSNLKNLYLCTATYAAGNNGLFPDNQTSAALSAAGQFVKMPYRTDSVRVLYKNGYLDDPGILQCKVAGRTGFYDKFMNNYDRDEETGLPQAFDYFYLGGKFEDGTSYIKGPADRDLSRAVFSDYCSGAAWTKYLKYMYYYDRSFGGNHTKYGGFIYNGLGTKNYVMGVNRANGRGEVEWVGKDELRSYWSVDRKYYFWW